jgi:hypothetical protein
MKKLFGLKKISAIFIVVLLTSNLSPAQGWSWNLGYNNPPGSTLGINFMHMWTNWIFEFGIGSASSAEDANGKTVSALAGGVNLKYLFDTTGLMTYVQGGSGAGIATGGGSTTLGVGGSAYGGLGFLAMGSKWYGYGSGNVASHGGAFVQVGFGHNF